MPLINCPTCKKQIASNAKACPSCGYPQQEAEGRKLLLLLLGILLVFWILWQLVVK